MDRASKPLSVCRRCIRQSLTKAESRRGISNTAQRSNADVQSTTASSEGLDANTVTTREDEERLMKENKKVPVGSRRRRALIAQMQDSISFERMPYQCFQEARKVLQEDRKEKLAEIESRRARIERIRTKETAPQNERGRDIRLASMRKALEELKIHADINDPLVKKKFEDGLGE